MNNGLRFAPPPSSPLEARYRVGRVLVLNRSRMSHAGRLRRGWAGCRAAVPARHLLARFVFLASYMDLHHSPARSGAAPFVRLAVGVSVILFCPAAPTARHVSRGLAATCRVRAPTRRARLYPGTRGRGEAAANSARAHDGVPTDATAAAGFTRPASSVLLEARGRGGGGGGTTSHLQSCRRAVRQLWCNAEQPLVSSSQSPRR